MEAFNIVTCEVPQSKLHMRIKMRLKHIGTQSHRFRALSALERVLQFLLVRCATEKALYLVSVSSKNLLKAM